MAHTETIGQNNQNIQRSTPSCHSRIVPTLDHDFLKLVKNFKHSMSREIEDQFDHIFLYLFILLQNSSHRTSF